MANKYVRSTDGNDADNGTTWALANATLVGLAADMSAGDNGYISHNYAEVDLGTTAMTIAFPGTAASPNKIICGNDAAEPPTTEATTGSLNRTGGVSTSTALFQGTFFLRGLRIFVNSTSTSAISFSNANGDMQVLENVFAEITNGGTAARISLGTNASNGKSFVVANNCTFKFGNTSQGFYFQKAEIVINGGRISASSEAITTLIATAVIASAMTANIRNFDLSSCASSLNICAANFNCNGGVTLERCKLPASWTGGLFAGAPVNPFFRVSMYNCDSGDTNYKLLVGDLQGEMRDETTLVMTGGASESWKVATSANANEAVTPFATDWMAKRNTAVGSAKTITVEILHDSTTDLTNGDIWLEVECLGTSGVPLGVYTSGRRGVLATAADHANSSVTWTTTGLTNPNKQYLTVSVTPQEAGNIMVKVMVAKASYTVYINPEFSIT